MSRICVFCGSRTGDDPAFLSAARQLGRFLAVNRHTLIYGGGSVGVMGVIADAVLEHKGELVGVIPVHLARAELMHSGVRDMRVTVDMHERKALMHSLTDIYVALPGGFGTMEELFEAVTWAQLELHAHPVIVLNLHGLYDGLVLLLDSMQSRGFLSVECRALVTIVNTTEALIGWLANRAAAVDPE